MSSKILAAIHAFAFAAVSLTALAADAPGKFSNGMLVGPNGMTLYIFDKDSANTGKSTCNGQCATLWPPLMATAGDRAEGAWSIVVRDDGSRQWAYKGKPVYYYQSDKQPGDRTGDNFRDVWLVVKE
ncbi:MAG: hypothetical protein J0H09_27395 [Burkholderiales bacterium]|nr:hypothetical protein [Burkholderiales bacterium]